MNTLAGFLIILGTGMVALWVVVEVPFPLNIGVVILMFGLMLAAIGESRKGQTDE